MDIIDRLINVASGIQKIYQKIIRAEYEKDKITLEKLKNDLDFALEVEEELLQKLDSININDYLKKCYRSYPRILFYRVFAESILSQNFNPTLRAYIKVTHHFMKNSFYTDANTDKYRLVSPWVYLSKIFEYNSLLIELNNNKNNTLEYFKIRYNLAFLNPYIEENIFKGKVAKIEISKGLLDYAGFSKEKFDIVMQTAIFNELNTYFKTVNKLPSEYFYHKFKRQQKYHKMFINSIFNYTFDTEEQIKTLKALLSLSSFNSEYYNFVLSLLHEFSNVFQEEMCYNTEERR